MNEDEKYGEYEDSNTEPKISKIPVDRLEEVKKPERVEEITEVLEQLEENPEYKAYYNETIKTKKTKNEKKPPNGSRQGSFAKFVAGVLIVSLVGGGAIGASFAATQSYLTGKNEAVIKEEKNNSMTPNIVQNGQGAVLPVSTNISIPDIAANVGPSVVSIGNTRTVSSWMGEFNQSGLGSGIIYKEDAEKVYIITNAHVVEGASSLVVTFLGNNKVPASIVGMDTITDIAVVAVNKADIPGSIKDDIKPAPIGDSDSLRVGDLAIAIGTPIAEAYNNTVTVGFISALNRQINVTDKQLNLIQTDAAINPGNSGGALVGPNGAVIGINTIKLSGEVEGMGFAIPMKDVIPVAEELMTNGKIARPALGITGQDMVESLANLYEMPVGVYVYQVLPGSSADIAGIKTKDIIIEFDNQKITTMNELKEILRTKKIGDTVPVKVIRGSSKKQIDVKLQEMPSTTTPTVQPQ